MASVNKTYTPNLAQIVQASLTTPVTPIIRYRRDGGLCAKYVRNSSDHEFKCTVFHALQNPYYPLKKNSRCFLDFRIRNGVEQGNWSLHIMTDLRRTKGAGPNARYSSHEFFEAVCLALDAEKKRIGLMLDCDMNIPIQHFDDIIHCFCPSSTAICSPTQSASSADCASQTSASQAKNSCEEGVFHFEAAT